MTTRAIDVHGLRESYKPKVVLDGIALSVQAGTVGALTSACRLAPRAAAPGHPSVGGATPGTAAGIATSATEGIRREIQCAHSS